MNKRRFWREFLVCTVGPALIPVVMLLPKTHFSEVACYILMGVLYLIDAIFIRRIYKCTEKENEDILINRINSIAYTNAFQLGERKRDYIIEKTYKEDYHVLKEMIPYDVHNYIAEICKNFRDTISRITSINQEHMSVTFIYHYDYKNATEADKSWRWVVGKEFSTRTELDRFVERENSLYNYLINGNGGKINSLFHNDKRDLARDGHYYMSPRDKDHNKIGSVFAIKVMFGNNAENFVEGILLVSSYGRKFVENNSEYTENGLRNLLFEELYPYYQRLIETELGILYLRHEKTQIEQNENECKKRCEFCSINTHSLSNEVVR